MEKHTAEDAETQRTRRGAFGSSRLDRVTEVIIGSAMHVHSAVGPGLLESSYEACLFQELQRAGLKVSRQVELPLLYRGVRIDLAYRIDLLVQDAVIVELKAVTKVLPIFEAQLMSYLRLTGLRVGLLINFHVLRLRDGIHRIVNNY